jgi:hypothetical protein
VRVSTRVREQLVGILFQPFLNLTEQQNAFETFQAEFPDLLIARVTADALGNTTVATAGQLDEDEAFVVAAGVATIKYSWGWDESAFIRVQANGMPFDVTVRPLEDHSFVVTQVAA